MDTTKDEFNIPNIIVDPRTRTQYSKGKFLGKVRLNSILCIYLFVYFQGGFARCYELIDTNTGQTFAGKVVPKSMLVKPHQKEKVRQTIISTKSNPFVFFFSLAFRCNKK
jgi:polo-like kinase 1